MSEVSAALLSTTFTTSAGSAMSSISRRPRQSSRLLSSLAWTIVTRYCMDCHLHSSISCSECSVVAQAGSQENTPVLSQLHWLPVQYCITFKILLLTYCALHGARPCVSHWVAGHIPTILGTKIRLAATSLQPLDEPAHLWGQLCLHCSKVVEQSAMQIQEAASLGAFKKALKTHLFRLAYSHLLEISDN